MVSSGATSASANRSEAFASIGVCDFTASIAFDVYLAARIGEALFERLRRVNLQTDAHRQRQLGGVRIETLQRGGDFGRDGVRGRGRNE